LETINDIIRNPLWGILTGLLGFYFGQRFNLWRDWRKEFNEIADIMFVGLSKERERLSPNATWVTNEEIITFHRRLPWWKRTSFDKCLARYQKAKKEHIGSDEYGGCFYHDTTPIAAAIDELMNFTKRK
jgi:hypothetical protein